MVSTLSLADVSAATFVSTVGSISSSFVKWGPTAATASESVYREGRVIHEAIPSESVVNTPPENGEPPRIRI